VPSLDDRPGETDPVPEHRERLTEAATRLETLVDAPSTDRRAWAEELRGAVVEMIDALAMHIDETEQPGGLYDEIMGDTPRLAHAVDILRREHVAMLQDASALIQMTAVASASLDEARLHDHAVALVRAVEKHQRRGLKLLYDFYEVDIGIGE
jgi:hypothetical protein